MNKIQAVHSILLFSFPEAKLTLEEPLYDFGYWLITVQLDDYWLFIEWREASGFTLTADPDHGYGEPADEYYSDTDSAMVRILTLMKNRQETIHHRDLK